MRVVIVEPHRVYRDPLVQAVTAAGDVVLAADGDGRLALGLIRRLHPDVALLGALMPGANGTDIVAALARDGPDVPVVLLADFRDESLLHAALEAGAAAYITKDTDRAQIVRALHAAADPTRAPRHLAGGIRRW